MLDAYDFRRRHLGDWAQCVEWLQLARETWEAYDREATAREVWVGPSGRRLHAPRMMPVGLPQGYRDGFHRLFDLHILRSFSKAQDAGFDGDVMEWRRQVKLAGQARPRKLGFLS